MHALRLNDDLWALALAKARDEGRTLTDVVTGYLQDYTGNAVSPPRAQRAKVKTGGCPHSYPDVRNVAGVMVCRKCG